MRIAIFSDIHANLPAMQAVRADIERRLAKGEIDAVYCLGDLGGYASQPNEVQEEVMEMGCPTILGNYDEGVGFNLDTCGCSYTKPEDIRLSDISFTWTRENTTAANKAWLSTLPRELRFEWEGRRVLLCHGSPRSTVEYLFKERSDGYLRQFTAGEAHDAQADLIVFGHTHVPFHRVVEDVHFVNTGSVGRPKDDDPRAGYSLLTVTSDQVEWRQVRLEYDVELAAKRLLEAGLPEEFATFLRTGGST